MAYADLQGVHNPATGSSPPAAWGDQARDNDEYLYNRGPFICTSATRPGSPFEGQLIYETDTDTASFYTGSAWQRFGSVRRVSGTTYTMTASFALVTSTTLTLPAGLWQICAKGQVNPGSGITATLRLQDTTNAATLDELAVAVPTVSPFLSAFLEGPLTAAGSTVVELQAKVSSVSGTQQVTAPTIWANPLLP